VFALSEHWLTLDEVDHSGLTTHQTWTFDHNN
jgi:hypothetical protein